MVHSENIRGEVHGQISVANWQSLYIIYQVMQVDKIPNLHTGARKIYHETENKEDEKKEKEISQHQTWIDIVISNDIVK